MDMRVAGSLVMDGKVGAHSFVYKVVLHIGTHKGKLEAENSEIVEIVRGMSISLADLPLVLQQLRGGASGHGGQKPTEQTEVTE